MALLLTSIACTDIRDGSDQNAGEIVKYNLRISRGISSTGEPRFEEISLHEWTALIEENDNLAPIDTLEGKNPNTGEKIVVRLQHAAQLNKGPILSWYEGVISTNSYSEALIPEYRKIAHRLGANIYGEQGETY